MWSFFGLLFFGGIFLYKVLEESIQDLTYNMQSNKERGIYEKIALNDEDELKYKEFCRNGKRFVKALEEIEDSMIYVFGEDWRKVISLYINPDNFNFKAYESESLHRADGMAYNMYLAYHGYIQRWYSVSLGGQKITIDRKLKALRVIEKYMQSAHPDMNLEIKIDPTKDYQGRIQTDINYCKARWNFVDYGYRRHVRNLSEVCDMWDEQRRNSD